MEDGQYELGGQPVTVVGNVATLTEGGAIAGSANKPNGLYENGSQRNANSSEVQSDVQL